MKIQLVSDLHLNFDRDEYTLPEVDRDVLVVAGDLGETDPEGVRFLRRELQRSPVIFVPGNHEYYGGEYHEIRTLWRSVAMQLSRQTPHRLHFLDNRAVTLGGVRFIGATMWTDFKGGDPEVMAAATRLMNDYQCVGFRGRMIEPADVLKLHRESRRFLMRELTSPLKRVVVSHHAPSPKSFPHGYRSPAAFYAYISDMDELIKLRGPEVWCHGHTHKRQDYTVGETRVLCNPRGYSGYEEVQEFDPTFTFEV